jgi:CRISPR-associated protein Cmr4
MHYGRYRRNDKGHSCAGKGGGDGLEHCGEETCRICTAFGFSRKQLSFQGLAQFADARILFFPVYSLAGPIWVTCATALAGAGVAIPGEDLGELDKKLQLAEAALVCGATLPKRINVGWLFLKEYVEAPAPAVTPPAPDPKNAGEWTIERSAGNPEKLSAIDFIKHITERIVVLSDSHFSLVVEDQLEVRTSVSISPETGAAESGALFTYEAIPRACFLFFDVTDLNPALYRVPVPASAANPRQAGPASREINYGAGSVETKDIKETVATGLQMTACLGIGGSNTRGMGRLRVMF